ncbi:hypothetical protein BASA61_002334 [Batrachochytrium salamandrivorans]|nr:hypothetical protein BASA61_002334 [Batrachochytrium salamandrivorans]
MTDSSKIHKEIEFPFPFPPWTIQEQFMQSLYQTLDRSHVGIFESPTGTGKSLSIICASLKWLRDHQDATIDEMLCEQDNLDPPNNSTDEPDWVLAHDRDRRRNEIYERLERRKAFKEEREVRLKRIRDRENTSTKRSAFKRKAEEDVVMSAENCPTESYLVDEYDSDDKDSAQSILKLPLHSTYEDDIDANLDSIIGTQLIYCARTHSQISQFVNEIKKTVYGDIRCVTLGSRKNMCINQRVMNLKSLSKINDTCLDMHKRTKTQSNKPSKSSDGCPYHLEDPVQMVKFDDIVHARIRDIEDIVKAGLQSSTCPYYGARHTSKTSEIICLPYNLLLQRSARESIGLRLENSVIILDEAHNIVDTMNSLYSYTVSLLQIRDCLRHLSLYFDRYQSRLSGRNVVYIKQLRMVLGAFSHFLQNRSFLRGVGDASVGNLLNQGNVKTIGSTDRAMTVSEFVDQAGIDHVNLVKILRYLEISRLPFKILGFSISEAARSDATVGNERSISTSVSPLACIQTFFTSLIDPDANGRIIYSYNTDPELCTVKYLLLNPADCFEPILRQARSVIFAGGTMSPIDDFIEQLLPSVPRDKIDVFTCGHVIKSTSLLPICVSRGPTGIEFNFSHEKRHSLEMIDEAGLAVANYCNVIPGGIVAFFVSYSYMESVVRRWRTSGIWDRISKRKTIFLEPASVGEVDRVLRDYVGVIDRVGKPGGEMSMEKSKSKPNPFLTGSLLLAVVSGKLSEGINFSDNMGRAVIMVGVPFANIASTELQERRSIRHKDDYATILFLDVRFKRDHIVKKLPEWIRSCGLVCPDQFGHTISLISKFFNSHQKVSNTIVQRV